MRVVCFSLSTSVRLSQGLGTSKPQEAKEYFQQLARHRIVFDYRGEEDKEAILLAFDKAKVEDRKAWVTRQRVC